MAAQPICYLSVAVLKTYDRKDFLMSLPYIQNEVSSLPEALDAYTFPEILLSVDRYGKGHINDTFCAVCQSQEGNAIRFIIQRLSNAGTDKGGIPEPSLCPVRSFHGFLHGEDHSVQVPGQRH